MDAEHVGLREMKKQMTRDAIAAAALKLTIERGLSEVTIEEIAQEAFVSPRTVSNYFASKEEAVLAAGMFGAEGIFEAFSDAPTGEPSLAILCRILSTYAAEHPDRLRMAAQVTELEDGNPSLRPFRLAQELELVEILSARIATRTGTDPTNDPYPSLVASATITAMVTALAIWSRNKLPDGRLPELIQHAFNITTAGYPPQPAKKSLIPPDTDPMILAAALHP